MEIKVLTDSAALHDGVGGLPTQTDHGLSRMTRRRGSALVTQPAILKCHSQPSFLPQHPETCFQILCLRGEQYMIT